MTDYENILEARIEAFQREIREVKEKNKQLEDLIVHLLRKRTPENREMKPISSCI
jgi:hypothetical protein